MFTHNFKYALKALFKNKALIFWTFVFPIILGTFFNMAFSNIENIEKLDVIDIAIVNNDDFNSNVLFKETFTILSNPNNTNRLFNTKYVTFKEAQALLSNNEITGYLTLADNIPNIVINTNGVNETILKQVTEEIYQKAIIIENIIKYETNKTNLSDIYKKIESLMNIENQNIKDISSENLSYTMIEFYTLIAMACLYGGMLGMTAINQNLANMSNKGKRIAVSPSSKIKLIFSSALAGYVVQVIGITLLFAYTIFVLNIDYGNNIFRVILLALTGSMTGLSLGIMVATLFKTNENLKTGVIISTTMFGCFLSGMMGITMKYVIDKNVPIINKLNPASMITDGFYSLYYYNTFNRFNFNVISLVVISLLMLGVSAFCLRRQKYDSI